MAHYNPIEIAEMKEGRKKAKKMKPPKKKYKHIGQDLYNEFGIVSVETNIKNKEVWKKKERARRSEELRVMRNNPGRTKKNKD